MAGRTIFDRVRVCLDDNAGTLREIPVNSINGVGLTYEEKDVTAWQEAIKNVLLATPDCTITLKGPFDNRAAVAASASTVAPALSGSFTVLSGIAGKNVPLAFGILIGMPGAYYTTGDPAFGLNYSAGLSGFLCKSFDVDPASMDYTAVFRVFGGVAPSWLNSIPTS